MERVKISRRSFLCAGAAAVGVGLGVSWAEPTAESDMVVAGNDLPHYLVGAAVKELGGMSRFVKPGDTVAVKPNFSWNCMPNASANAANTDPDVVKTVVELCIQAGADDVKVIDNTLTNPPDLGLRTSQIKGKLSSYGQVECKTLNDSPSEFERVSISQLVGDLGMSKDVLGADVFINVPKLKNHDEAVATVSMKNLMGIVDDRDLLHRKGLHKPIADLSRFLLDQAESSGQRQLVLVDAVRALQEGGPGGPGKVVSPGVVVAATDPVDADEYAVGLLGLSASEVPHLRIAKEEYGMGSDLQPLQLDVSSLPKEGLLPDYPLPTGSSSKSGVGRYLLPGGVAAAAVLGVALIYSRKGKATQKGGRAPGRKRSG